jgi:hypothetical protein
MTRKNEMERRWQHKTDVPAFKSIELNLNVCGGITLTTLWCQVIQLFLCFFMNVRVCYFHDLRTASKHVKLRLKTSWVWFIVLAAGVVVRDNTGQGLNMWSSPLTVCQWCQYEDSRSVFHWMSCGGH